MNAIPTARRALASRIALPFAVRGAIHCAAIVFGLPAAIFVFALLLEALHG